MILLAIWLFNQTWVSIRLLHNDSITGLYEQVICEFERKHSVYKSKRIAVNSTKRAAVTWYKSASSTFFSSHVSQTKSKNTEYKTMFNLENWQNVERHKAPIYGQSYYRAHSKFALKFVWKKTSAVFDVWTDCSCHTELWFRKSKKSLIIAKKLCSNVAKVSSW